MRSHVAALGKKMTGDFLQQRQFALPVLLWPTGNLKHRQKELLMDSQFRQW